MKGWFYALEKKKKPGKITGAGSQPPLTSNELILEDIQKTHKVISTGEKTKIADAVHLPPEFKHLGQNTIDNMSLPENDSDGDYEAISEDPLSSDNECESEFFTGINDYLDKDGKFIILDEVNEDNDINKRLRDVLENATMPEIEQPANNFELEEQELLPDDR